MQFSPTFASSRHCHPSPDGKLIASVQAGDLTFRETGSLHVLRTQALPVEVASSLIWLLWSTTSEALLVASAELIAVYRPHDAPYTATIAHPTSGMARISHLCFGADDDEVCVFQEHGLRLTIFDLSTSRSVEIAAPKLFAAATAARGFGFRPATRHLALMTRAAGKDVVSVHARRTFEVLRSWTLDLVDAQGLQWSPDGRFLAAWESAAHGHKMVIYTADGHAFKVWNGPSLDAVEDRDLDLGAGIKLLSWSAPGACIAVADYTERIVILSAPAYTESSSLRHAGSITPTQDLKIWQEQIGPSPAGHLQRDYVEIKQVYHPPTSQSSSGTDTMGSMKSSSGITSIAFDQSGTLLASGIEHMPTTVWIWDVRTGILRMVLTLHAPVVKVTWHPSINELLMIRCEGEEEKALAHLWDPSWPAPQHVDFTPQLPEGKTHGKALLRWLDMDFAQPVLLYSDCTTCLLATMADESDLDLPWNGRLVMGTTRQESRSSGQKAEQQRDATVTMLPTDDWTAMNGMSDDMDDTFHFKKPNAA